jgi:hypothetical protein
MENKDKDPAARPDDNAQPKAKLPHRWKPGESGNPAGAKRGSRHKASLLAESLIDGETDRLTRRCIYEAIKGDMRAMKLCLERLLPPVRERPLPRSFKLPRLETLNDASHALAMIIAGVTTGELLPGQGESLAAIVNSFLKSIEASLPGDEARSNRRQSCFRFGRTQSLWRGSKQRPDCFFVHSARRKNLVRQDDIGIARREVTSA